jgi:hypothetical protein
MAREQLSVKRWLMVIAIVSAPILAWGLYRTTFTDSISAVSCKAGQPITVRGRYPGWWGADYILIAVREQSPDAVTSGEQETASSGGGTANRGWLGNYHFETTMDPISEPGNYQIVLNALMHDRASTATTFVTVSP